MPESQSSQSDDAALVKQAKSGDSRAFGMLYERYAADIYRFLNAQLPGYMEAEDLTSDVFLRAWQSLPGYRERGFSFSAFLYKVARNALIDHWRKQKREIYDPRLQLDEMADEVNDIHERFSPQQDSRVLWQILAQIREDYRAVLIFRFINGLTPREIANIMGRSEGAVRVLQHRALAVVRQQMAACGDFNDKY